MKQKYITFALLSILPWISISCDGGGSDEGKTLAERDAATAESLEINELKTGDTILFKSSANVPVVLSILDLDASGLSVSGGATYLYTKTNDHLFSINRTDFTDEQGRLTQSLVNTLTDFGTGANLGSRLRELLHRENATFSRSELAEITRILSPHGANLVIASDGQLVAAGNETHTCLVTSTVRAQAQGSMSGTYSVEAPSTEIGFRRPNANELAVFRFISADDWIPFVTATSRPSSKIEEGTWDLELSASPF